MQQADLRDLSFFLAVAEQRNFRRAARALGISVSSLSQRLRELEEQLGLRLLNRTTRSVALTEAGAQLLARIAAPMQDLSGALRDMASLRGVPAGRLRINAPEPAVHHALEPSVAAFLRQYPEIDLEVAIEPMRIDIVSAGFDAGIRYGEHLAQDMVAVPIAPPQRYVVVASPAFAAAAGPLREPQDLLRHPCISVLFPNGAQLPWEFEKDGRTVTITPHSRLLTTDIGLRVQAAIAGVGFMLGFEDTLRPAIAAGRLVTVLEDWCPEFDGPFLYYPSRRQNPPALAAFISFMTAWRNRQMAQRSHRKPAPPARRKRASSGPPDTAR
ncbi:MAG TPA: LysR substrate-binding domain-containing protein [Ferrovibrio sp.]|uniref:LysR substrate-binding domain-containing protein n=1 Tax=Ferrovibrio sp. TaxID=1917215 RepID=UPI002ED46488